MAVGFVAVGVTLLVVPVVYPKVRLRACNVLGLS
jgi:hypothetical protein